MGPSMRALIVAAALLLALPASAQQQVDHSGGVWEQLLTEANRRIVALATQLEAAKAEIARLKGDPEKPAPSR